MSRVAPLNAPFGNDVSSWEAKLAVILDVYLVRDGHA